MSALRVDIRASNHIRGALVGVTLLALAAIAYADLNGSLRLPLALSVLLYSGHCWRAQQRQRGVLRWHETWRWHAANGMEQALRLRHCTVWPGFIVLIFSVAEAGSTARWKRDFVLTLCADSFADADSARRLRVHLHHFPVFAAAADERPA